MGILRVFILMTTPSDFPDLGGGGTPPRPPRPPRRPPPAGGGGPQMPQMPQMPNVNKKAVFVGAIVVLSLVFLVGAFVSGKGGIIEVNDREVAVIVNYMTGESEIVNRPGYKVFIPFLAQAFVFDKSPNSFIMEGERDVDANHVRKLTVRANDGSSFWFESLEIQYQIIPGSAQIVLHDSGPGENFKQNWVKAFARSVLRDEFGRFSTEEIADAQNLSKPKSDAKDRLNKMLEPHGIFIMQIITPKPKFETRYERAIEERKEAGQLVETLKERENKLVEERIKRLANVERDKATEYELLLGTMENNRISEEKVAVRVTKTADAYRIEKVGAGKAAEGRLTQQARGLELQARKEAEGLRAKVEALAARGDILVREELARKFSRITFEIIPYRRDPSPTRIEHLGAIPVGQSSGGNN
jgi:membrane protease subunit HflC